jgi:hypothetical protein
MFAAAVDTSAFVLTFMLFAVAIARAVYPDGAKRSLFRVAALCTASLAMLPVFAVVPILMVSGDLAEGLHHFWRGCCFAPVIPAALILMSRQFAEEMRYHSEWAELEV